MMEELKNIRESNRELMFLLQENISAKEREKLWNIVNKLDRTFKNGLKNKFKYFDDPENGYNIIKSYFERYSARRQLRKGTDRKIGVKESIDRIYNKIGEIYNYIREIKDDPRWIENNYEKFNFDEYSVNPMVVEMVKMLIDEDFQEENKYNEKIDICETFFSEIFVSPGTVTEEIEEDGFIGESNPMMEVRNKIRKVAKTDYNVLIVGETGTGKELVSKSICRNSNRSDKPFCKIDCSTIPSNLIESELFGHSKGSFTGAVKDKQGLFEEAAGGTLFIDEIGNIPEDAQYKLLNAIESKTIRRVGSVEPVNVDVRLIFATNRALIEMIKENKFSMDLYFRISQYRIDLPTLNEREGDIDLLLKYIVSKVIDKENEKRDKKDKVTNIRINKSFLDTLKKCRLIGNIRQLENIVIKTLINSEFTVLSLKYLPDDFNIEKEISPDDGEEMTLKEFENKVKKKYITSLLKKYKSITDTAEILGITRPHLHRLIRELGINV